MNIEEQHDSFIENDLRRENEEMRKVLIDIYHTFDAKEAAREPKAIMQAWRLGSRLRK